MNIDTMTDAEVEAELNSTQNALPTDKLHTFFTTLESNLKLRAACLGWTGDPLCQPPRVILAVAREVLRDLSKPA